jgi:hypothetical protein
MKLNVNIFFLLFFVSILNYSFIAQEVSKGKSLLIEFSNTSEKFKVPEGKSWVIYNVFSDNGANPKINKFTQKIANDPIYIFLKSINGTTKTNLASNNFGTMLYYSDDNSKPIKMPVVFPENTIFELLIVHFDYNDEIFKLFDGVGYLSVIETDY